MNTGIVNNPIHTNRLDVQLNRKAFARQFDIFAVTTSKKFFQHGANIFDIPLLYDRVRSICYERGNTFYILMNAHPDNKSILKNALSKAEDGSTVTFSLLPPHEYKDSIVVQLLLNSLGTYESELLRFNNLTGNLYCFHPNWLHHGKGKGNQHMIWKIPTLKLDVSSDMHLSLRVQTFTSEYMRAHIDFSRKNFEEYTKYIFAANQTLRRKNADDEGPCYIMRQIKGDKSEITFLDLQSEEKFAASKMGVLEKMFALFNRKFESVCHLGYMPICEYTSLDHTRTVVKENRRTIASCLAQKPLKLIDQIGDEYSARFCEELAVLFQEKYGICVSIGKNLSHRHLNICLIHEASYYMGGDDPHNKKHDGYAVQHITLENLAGNAKSALSAVVHEVLIKDDLVNQRINLFDWSALGLKESISFGICEENRYFFMKVYPDGHFDMSEQKFDLLELGPYIRCVSIFQDQNDIRGIIMRENGDINIIRDTGLFTIPEIHDIQNLLACGDNHLRGKERRQELMTSVLDIKLFTEDGATYYFVGTIGEGMRSTIQCSANIRKIESYQGAPVLFEELLPLMNVTFVHNGQLTVIPFPFKYLREYVAQVRLNEKEVTPK